MAERKIYRLDGEMTPHLIDFEDLKRGDRFQIVDDADNEDQAALMLGVLNDVETGIYREVRERMGKGVVRTLPYTFPMPTSKEEDPCT